MTTQQQELILQAIEILQKRLDSDGIIIPGIVEDELAEVLKLLRQVTP